MNRNKRDNYNLKASFHTFQLKSNVPAGEEDLTKNPCVNAMTINKEGTVATTIINPNRREDDVFTFSDFRRVCNEIFTEIGVEDYRIMRADFRLDSYNKEHFRDYAKLNKYLIAALAVSYNSANNYRTVDLFSDATLNICVKADYFQAECYDRDRKNKVTGNTSETAKARLEERSIARQMDTKWKRLTDGDLSFSTHETNMDLLKEEFTNGWATRWSKARGNLKKVQDKYNQHLLEKYRDGKNARPVQFRDVTDFIIQNQDSIFTTRQMVDLLTQLNAENPELGIRNPKGRATYYKKKYGFEYISQGDVDHALKEIQRATEAYFEG